MDRRDRVIRDTDERSLQNSALLPDNPGEKIALSAQGNDQGPARNDGQDPVANAYEEQDPGSQTR
jgi:hypothetical protein